MYHQSENSGVSGGVLYTLIAFVSFSFLVSVILLVLDPISELIPVALPLTSASADAIDTFVTIINITPVFFALGISGYVMAGSLGAEMSTNDYIEGVGLIITGIIFGIMFLYVTFPTVMYCFYAIETALPAEMVHTMFFSDWGNGSVYMSSKKLIEVICWIPTFVCYAIFLIKPIKNVWRKNTMTEEYTEEEVW
jgi:hypothetical protein